MNHFHHHLVLITLLLTHGQCRHVQRTGTCLSTGSGVIMRVSLSNCVQDEARVRAGRQGFLGDTNTPVISYSPDNEVTTDNV